MDVDLSGGIKNGARIQLWECNGHESQLWYFDSGTDAIKWAGDANYCIDSGSTLKPGTQLYLWDCNALEQQYWWYDQGSRTIFLAKSASSASDASFCMDLSGGMTDLGRPIQLWGCDGWPNQKWNLQPGVTIRSEGYGGAYCLDLEGGNTGKGTTVQMFSCNGLMNQKWIFDQSSWSIRPVLDESKCLDAGPGFKPGQPLHIWDCNGQNQQNWGYDDDSKAVYLARSESDANLCLDLDGGNLIDGGQAQVWSCNGCWNQRWIVVGPVSAALKSSSSPSSAFKSNVTSKPAKKFLQRSEVSTCAGYPPSPVVPGHCMSGDQHNWPVFKSKKQLLANSAWTNYFKMVYGEVPSTGYSICTGNLMLIYQDQAAKAGIKFDPAVSGWCPKQDGELYNEMGFPHSGFLWLYNRVLSQPYIGKSGTTGLPGQTWVEILHSQDAQDGEATWFYYTPGSAMWLHLGSTRVYNNHPDAVGDLLGQKCKYQKGDLPNECELQFPDLYVAAVNRGLATIQFLYHADMSCGGGRQNLAIEILDFRGPGRESCSGWGGALPMSRFRAGWEAKNECNCNSNLDTINCQGFGMWR